MSSESRCRALLMTDLVDSTSYARAVGDIAMAPLWAMHDLIARDLLVTWRGLELEKTDGIVALFDSAAQAVAYVLAYHQGLQRASFPLRARAAIHFAGAELRETSVEHLAVGAKHYEVDGILKAMSARILSLADGGQTLATTQVRDAAPGAPWRWHSHGYWHFKGFDEPVEVLEVRDDAYACEALRDAEKAYRVVRHRDLWLPARDIGHNVPAERDSFVGRREPLNDLARRFAAGARIVSLVGTGGTGKTRLALRYAWERLGEYDGGTWFCDLAAARSLEGVCFAVARALGIALLDKDPVAQLGRAMAGRGRCLIALDNFEQVVAHAEETVGCWLEAAGQATFLVTTREILHIRGEEILGLSPMPLDEGIELFLRRAKAVRQDYDPTGAEFEAVTQLVRGLDRLPLALELAAARVQVLSATSMLARLNKRFDWLSSRAGHRDRQATLRAAFDWSWDLLGEGEKAALAYLSTFEGGFTLDAAQAVLRRDVDQAEDGAELVESLLAKSLIGHGGEGRFQLLESVREYAREQLFEANRFQGSGPLGASRAFERHWDYYGRLDEAAAATAKADAGNLVVAGRRAITARAAEAACRCVRGAWALLLLAGPFRVAVDLADAILSLSNLLPRQRALGHCIAGSARELLGEVEPARKHFLAGLECLLQTPDAEIEARLLIALGARQCIDGELDAAAASLDLAGMRAVAVGDRRLQIFVAINQGKLSDHQGRVSHARSCYQDALALAREIPDRRLEGGILGNLGGVNHCLGRLTQARTLYRQSVDIAHEVGDLRWEGNGLCNLGLLCQEQGDLARARECLEDSAAIARTIGHVALEYTVLCNLGILAEAEGRDADAILAFEQSVVSANRAGDRRAEGQFLGYLAIVLARRGDYERATECLRNAGVQLNEMSDRLSLAVLACQRAEVLAICGQLDDATAALDSARIAAAELGAELDSELTRQMSRAESAMGRRELSTPP